MKRQFDWLEMECWVAKKREERLVGHPADPRCARVADDWDSGEQSGF